MCACGVLGFWELIGVLCGAGGCKGFCICLGVASGPEAFSVLLEVAISGGFFLC